MTSLTFATLLQASIVAIGANGADSYAEAHHAASKTGEPIVVMVSASWCAPCQEMKRTVLPQCRKRGLFRRVKFCIVDTDRERKLAQKLTGGGPVPQLIMYRKTRQGWVGRRLVGGQSVKTVENFISKGIAADEATSKAPAKEKAPKQQQQPSNKVADKPKIQPASTRQAVTASPTW